MKRLFIFIACLTLLIPCETSAQAKRNKKKSAKIVTVEDPRFESMLSSTAKVMVIDSIVVDSLYYLDAILTNPEEGNITTYGRFFKGEGNEIVYINQIGNKCIYSGYDEDLNYKVLYKRDLLADGWTYGEVLKGLDDNGRLYDINYPYLMPDGVTLYFSARSNEGLGGYDIYRTRFDADKGGFLRPENLGLPFNSKSDDYMFVIDEQNNLGYFVSNRRQPQGKTCVYTFIPSETRKTIPADHAKLRSLANLDRIADTWEDASELKAALARKTAVEREVINRRKQVKEPVFHFIVNDQKTYTYIRDFKKNINRNRMQDLLAKQRQLQALKGSVDKARNYYATASSQERKKLSTEILNSEQQIKTLRIQIRQLEKDIRNTENL